MRFTHTDGIDPKAIDIVSTMPGVRDITPDAESCANVKAAFERLGNARPEMATTSIVVSFDSARSMDDRRADIEHVLCGKKITA